MKRIAQTIFALALASFTQPAIAQDVLPFPEPPSASVAGKTLKDSTHQWRQAESHLPKDAPNIVIFMTDDAGFAHPSTFGGPVHTPTLDRLAAAGISYNAFHTTAMCSPTRAALLTGRNHHRVGARPDRRAGLGLGRVCGQDPQVNGHLCPGAVVLRL